MSKRAIRFKEYIPNSIKVHFPSRDYLKKTPQLKKHQAYFQRVDENGFTTTHLVGKADYRVIIIGDSFVENIFVDESKRIASIMERLFLEEGKRVAVLNAGVSGATGLGLLNVILNKVVFYKPDLLIYVQPSCDFSALLFQDGYLNDSKLFSNLTPSLDTDKFFYETIEDNSEQIYKNLVILDKACSLNNIQLYLATCCSDSSRRQLKMMNDMVRREFESTINLIDLDVKVPRGSQYFYDKQHLNEAGSEFVANIFKNAIRESCNECGGNNLLEVRALTLIYLSQKATWTEIIKLPSRDSSFSISFKTQGGMDARESSNEEMMSLSFILEYFDEGVLLETKENRVLIPVNYELEQSLFLSPEHNLECSDIRLGLSTNGSCHEPLLNYLDINIVYK